MAVLNYEYPDGEQKHITWVREQANQRIRDVNPGKSDEDLKDQLYIDDDAYLKARIDDVRASYKAQHEQAETAANIAQFQSLPDADQADLIQTMKQRATA